MDIVLAMRLTVDCWLLPVTALVALSTPSVPSVYILSRFTFDLVQYISVVISRAILGLCGGSSSSLLSTSETLLDTCTTMRNWRSASLVTRASAEWNGSGSRMKWWCHIMCVIISIDDTPLLCIGGNWWLISGAAVDGMCSLAGYWRLAIPSECLLEESSRGGIFGWRKGCSITEILSPLSGISYRLFSLVACDDLEFECKRRWFLLAWYW